MKLDFIDAPPPDARGVGQSTNKQILEQLHANPNKWACIVKGVNPRLASDWRKRKGLQIKTVPAETQGDGPRKIDIWACYTPSEEPKTLIDAGLPDQPEIDIPTVDSTITLDALPAPAPAQTQSGPAPLSAFQKTYAGDQS